VVDVEPVSVTIMTPRRLHGEVETYFYWTISQVEQTIRIREGGHYYHPLSGGDSFTVFLWEAAPESEAEYLDYSDALHMVPDLVPFEISAHEMTLSSKDYSVEVEDESNELLDDQAGDLEDSVEASDDDPGIGATYDEDEDDREGDEDEPTDSESAWTVEVRTPPENQYLSLIDPDKVNTREPQYAYGLDECHLCNRSLSTCGLAVDGRLKGKAMWGNFCASCHARAGEGVGWGIGQLYAQQADGSWRLVAGFRS
jgi:hypothetical protein